MTKKVLADARERDLIANDLDATFVVEAAAGTGKTTALVERILSLLCSGRATLASGAGDLVAVTFTEKAAGEMKLRLRTEIERARTKERSAAESARLDQALEQLEAARIGTIHAFCADLLRERPVEAAIDPLFEVAAEDEQERLYEEAFTRWFQATLARDASEVPGVSRVLRRATRERDQDGPRAALRKAGRTLVEQRDFPTPYEKPLFDRRASLDEIVERLKKLAALAPKGFPDSWLTKSLVEIQRVVYEIERREEPSASGQATPRDHDAVEAQLRTLLRARLWGWKGSGQWFCRAEGISRQEVLDRRQETKEALAKVLDAADADLAATLFVELWGIVDGYEAAKKTSGRLDFLDLLVLTRDLLRENAAVRAELQRRFSHLLIDEFQDTDPLQAEILFLLAASDPAESDPDRAQILSGKLFLVGDPKQSIYRFRRADVSLYEGIKDRLVRDGARVLHLSTSFRSAPSIQSFVNTAFAPLMPKATEGGALLIDEPRSQAEYSELKPFRDEPAGRPTIVALPVPSPYGDYKKIVQWKIEESFPDAVGAFVDWLIRSSGWTITERGSDVPTAIRSHHVCLLFKRLQSFGNDVTRPYVRALEARRIPHVLVGGRSFHEREEVIALRNALTAIEWPDDTFSVYAALHGPFFALNDDALLAFRHANKHLHPLRRRDVLTDLTKPVGDALDILADLHRRRNRRTIADTITRLLEATRAHAGVAIWPAGEQALGNILRLLDMARRFEQGAVTSFRAFVARLDEDAARGGVNEAPVVEEGTDGVRIMTVHKAKGLEFPVVILVDPTANATMQNPSRFVDPKRKLWAVPLCGAAPKELLDKKEAILQQDLEEAHRLLYVATTRARELLVVPVIGDDRDDESDNGWLDPLGAALYPAPEARRSSEAAAGCPTFGEDTVYFRPDNVERDADWSVRPGLHRPQAGSHRVVFWDPHVLDLGREDEAGLRHERVLAKGPATEASLAHNVAWRARRTETRGAASVPTLAVRTVTDAKDDATTADASAGAITVERSVGATKARPHGKRFGILVHAVLATVALDADPTAIADAARIQGRITGATEEEVDAARDVVKSALAHDLLARARKAKRALREVCVMLREDDGTITEGVIDLAFQDQDAWVVVDFKTDLEMGDREAGYRRQVGSYAAALAAATGDAVTGALLVV